MKYLLSIIFFIYVLNSNAQEKKVLIIGNSLMSYNELPKNLQIMMDLNDKKYKIHQITSHGGSLRSHIDNYRFNKNRFINITRIKAAMKEGVSKERIRQLHKLDFDVDTIKYSTLGKLLLKNSYNVIFVQEHGSYIDSDLGLKYIANKSVKRFYSLIDTSKTKVIFFSEYPGKKAFKYDQPDENINLSYTFLYDTLSCYPLSKKDSTKLDPRGVIVSDKITLKKSLKAFNNHYINNLNSLKDQYGFTVAPTSNLFISIKEKYPKMKLFRAGGHPSAKASYMFQYVYYYLLTGGFSDIDDKIYRFRVNKKKKALIKSEVKNYFNDIYSK